MFLEEVVASQKRGEIKGITSICSSHPWVIKAALLEEEKILIEATCNQVNQYGGYTGKTPGKFISFVREIALETGYPFENIMFGGDHLGPNVWQGEPATSAMQKSEKLVSDYIRAGFTKIHLDCSMCLADDPPRALDPEISARRTAQLAKIAEQSHEEGYPLPYYIIGTEVPIPGGAMDGNTHINVTKVEDVRRTLEITHKAFKQEGLDSAWDRVIALVVQPGVEYGDDFIIRYNRKLTKDLSRFIEDQSLVYEAHSTDYQSQKDLSNLVEDHFAILKVGPALTFSFREAIFSLAMIEDELFPEVSRSNLIRVIEDVMIEDPRYWIEYFKGSENEVALARKYSLSDRIRYYWNCHKVQVSLKQLLINLNDKSIPTSLLRQYGLTQSREILSKGSLLKPQSLVLERICEVLDDYKSACR